MNVPTACLAPALMAAHAVRPRPVAAAVTVAGFAVGYAPAWRAILAALP